MKKVGWSTVNANMSMLNGTHAAGTVRHSSRKHSARRLTGSLLWPEHTRVPKRLWKTEIKDGLHVVKNSYKISFLQTCAM